MLKAVVVLFLSLVCGACKRQLVTPPATPKTINPSSTVSALPQIQRNAQSLISNLGPHSGISPFGYNAASVAYLDGFIDRQGQGIRSSPQAIENFVSMAGAFLGEAVIATYGGEWQQNESGICIRIQARDQYHLVMPFQRIQNRLLKGTEYSLAYFFSTAIPQIVSGSASSGPPPLPSQGPPPLPK